MRELVRTTIAIVVGLGTLLVSQMTMELVARWATGDLAPLDDPILNGFKLGIAAVAAVVVGATIATTREDTPGLVQARISSKKDISAAQL